MNDARQRRLASWGHHDTYWPLSGVTDVGDIWLTSIYEAGEIVGVSVARADPAVLVSADLLLDNFHNDAPFLTLKCAGVPACPIGDVFTIEAVNTRLVYVVTAPADDRCCYIARWPD
jgi:hypothetical protein